VTAEREEVVDFTTPYYDFAGIQIVMRSIAKNQSMFVFVSVFSNDVWSCWGAVLVATAVLIFIFEKLTAKFDNPSPDHCADDRRPFSLSEAVWFVVASFTKAGMLA
jgi:hypothetical protein